MGKKKYKGYSLVATILILGMVLTVAVSLAFATVMGRRGAIGGSKSGVSYQKADEGVEKILYELTKGTYTLVSDLSDCNSSTGLIETSEYKVELRDELDDKIDCDSNVEIIDVKGVKSVGVETELAQRAVEAPVFLGRCGGGIDSSTKLLIHSDSQNGDTDFEDISDSSHSITPQDDVKHSDEESKFSTTSIKFDGTEDYLSIADSDDWNFGDGDFTVDLWVNFEQVNIAETFLSQWVDDNNFIIFVYAGGADELRFRVRSGGVYTIEKHEEWNPEKDTWYHIAVTRNGDDFNLYVNGIKLGSTYTSSESVPNLGSDLEVGALNWSTGRIQYLDGFMDELRVSKGVDRTQDTSDPLYSFDGCEEGQRCYIPPQCVYSDNR